MKLSRWRSLNLYHCYLLFAWLLFISYVPVANAEMVEFDHQFAFRLEKSIQQTIVDEVAYEASINQQSEKENLIVLRDVRGNLLVSEQDVMRWKLPIPYDSKAIDYKGSRFYATSNLNKATYRIDDASQKIEVELPVSSFNNSIIDNQRPYIEPHKSSFGSFFNYDFFLQKNNFKSVLDTNFELGVFNQYGVGLWSTLVRDVGRSSNIVRLDTSWTIDQPENISSWRFGDAISRGGNIGSSVRFGGVQYATNFATRPDLVTFPELSLNGSTALPSTIDVYLNNIKSFSQEIAPGPFTLNNLPVFTGSGEAKLVVRDLLGREQVITQPYYASRSLLSKNLHDYSYEAGFERQDYAVASDHYRDFFSAGTHRYGFSEYLTGEVHGEAQAKRQLVSLGAVYLLANVGVVDATVAASRTRDNVTGELISVGYEQQGEALSFGARTQLANRSFIQLGQLDNKATMARLSSVFVGWHQASFGSLSVSYINQLNRDTASNRFANISYNRNFLAGWFFNLTVLRDLENKQGNLFLASFTKAFDQNTTGNISATHSPNIDESTVEIQHNLPIGTGYGYRVLAGLGDNKRAEVGVSAQNNVGTYTLEAASTGNQQAYRASVSGGVVYVPGQLMFSRRLSNSFAVVDVGGYPNVGIYSENQLIGKTNSDGMQVIPNLRAYQPNNIAIEPQDIKLDAQIAETKLIAVPYFRSAEYLKFSVRKENAATLRILQKNGQIVPSGVIFKLQNADKESYPVAQNGLLYLTKLEKKNHLKATWGDQQCDFDLTFPDNAELIPELGEFRCN